MRNPSWCTPEQSLHHLCKQSTYCFFQELISSWVSGCQACTLRVKLAWRKEEKRERKREPEKHWPTRRASSEPARDIFILLSAGHASCSINCDGLTRAEPPSKRKQLQLTHHEFLLKSGRGRGGAGITQKISPLLFYYSFAFEDHTVPFPLSLLLGAFDLNIGIPTLSSGSCPWR